MPIHRKLILFVSLGFVAVLLATLLNTLAVHWRGLLVFSGGWLMAVGVLYKVQLYAQRKDEPYSAWLRVFAGVVWLSMTVATLYWLGTLMGVV